ncbi:MAG: DUF3307 domain-containing protein [Actinoplanes sp.]
MSDLGTWYATLITAHAVGDHIVQSDRDACEKALPGRTGQLACVRHVVSYTATAALALAATAAVTGTRARTGRVLAGLAVSAISHYVIDRRVLLKRFAEATGKARFFQLGAPRPGHDDNPTLGTGAYALDQSAHHFFLFAAALIIAGGAR